MSILSVDNISPIGSGTSVTINNAATLVLNNVSVAGVTTFASNVFLGDDDNLYLGASNDLRIYHDAGAASHINAVGLVNIDGTTGVRLEYNNANRVYCTSSGVTLGGDIEIADKIVHEGDTNTAIRFPSADQISFETGGTNRLKLHNYASNNHVEVDASAHLSLAVNGSNSRNITIGDGDASSTGQLFLQAGGRSQAYGGGITLYSHSNSTNAGGVYIGKSQGSSGSIIFGNGGTSAANEYLRINSSGHVVPGTDSQYDLGLTGTRWRNLYADTLYGNGANLTGIEAFVTGMILLWSGSAGSIPSGFVLCNGSNSTPDLRGRFVVGYHDSNGDYDVGDTGGATTVTLAESQIPSHSHSTNNHNHSFSSSHTHGVSGSVSGSTNTTGNHSHTWQRQDVGINVGYRPWPASNNDVRSQDVSTSSAGNHSHTFSGSFSVTSGSGTASGTTGNANPSTNTAGGGGSHENRPPYYALCYIMKT